MSKNIIFNKKFTTSQKFAYGIGDMACQFIYGTLGAFILIFWTDVVGIAAATTSTMILVSKVWDAINDPLMGAFIDGHEFGGEKVRPYIKWFAIPFGIAAIISFITPDASMTVKIIYAFLSYNITNMIYTAINIPYGLLPVKMTTSVDERGSLSVVRMFCGMTGYAIVTIFVPTVVGTLGYFWTFAILGIAASIMWFIVYFKCEELPKDDEEEVHIVAFKPAAKALVKNRVWIILASGMLFYTIGAAIASGAASYYAIYYLSKPALITACLLIPALGQITSLAFIIDKAFKKIGKVKTTQISLVSGAFVNILIFLLIGTDGNVAFLFILLYLSGMSVGAVMPAIFAMLGDSIEYGEYKTGVRIEGLTYAGASLGQKAGAGIGLAIIGSVLAFVGYVPNATQTAEVLLGIKFTYMVIPAAFYLLFAVALIFNPLDKIYKDVERALVKRRTGMTE